MLNKYFVQNLNNEIQKDMSFENTGKKKIDFKASFFFSSHFLITQYFSYQSDSPVIQEMFLKK